MMLLTPPCSGITAAVLLYDGRMYMLRPYLPSGEPAKHADPQATSLRLAHTPYSHVYPAPTRHPTTFLLKFLSPPPPPRARSFYHPVPTT